MTGPAPGGPPRAGPGGAGAGLCDACRHQRLVPTRRSTFSMCERSRDDPRFPRYPALPVRSCAGHEAHAGSGPRP